MMGGDDDYAPASYLLDTGMCKKRKKKDFTTKLCRKEKNDDAAFSYGYLGRIKKHKSPFPFPSAPTRYLLQILAIRLFVNHIKHGLRTKPARSWSADGAIGVSRLFFADVNWLFAAWECSSLGHELRVAAPLERDEPKDGLEEKKKKETKSQYTLCCSLDNAVVASLPLQWSLRQSIDRGFAATQPSCRPSTLQCPCLPSLPEQRR